MITFKEFVDIKYELNLFEAEWFDRLHKEIIRRDLRKTNLIKKQDEKIATEFVNDLNLSFDNYKKTMIINQIVKYIEASRNSNNQSSREEASDIIDFLSGGLFKIDFKDLISLQSIVKNHLEKTYV